MFKTKEAELTAKKEFTDWLERFVIIGYQTKQFFDAAWNEALDAEACGRSFELSARYSATRGLLLYRIT